MRLCISDAHEGLKNAIGRILGCPWQRCTVHFAKDMRVHVDRPQQQMVSAALRQIFGSDREEQARRLLGEVADRLQTPVPKVAAFLEEAEEDLLAFTRFPPEHWSKLRSTNPLERVNRDIARRSDVVGIYPNDQSLIRLAGALRLEQNDEWLVGRRYLSLESLAKLEEEVETTEEVERARRVAADTRREVALVHA
ncbi:MAG: transposase [Dehalococcoidales bacterium]|nr:transposase [Dehalococcoidales bacterium]